MAREFYDEETNELLTDLSEIPKKQLSKKQRENKRTAKREGYVDKDLDGKPDKRILFKILHGLRKTA